MTRAAPPLVLLLAACAHRGAPVDYSTPPHLPSPRAGTYARVVAEPPDPAVTSAMGGVAWDASLGGAAAGLALERSKSGACDLAAWQVQDAVWRAGYPYPTPEAACWLVDAELPPPDAVRSWVGATEPGQDVGLVRARGDIHDVWVALRATPVIDLGVLPIQPSRGQLIELPAVPGAELIVSDPDGWLVRAPLDEPQVVDVDVSGEWMVEIRRGGVRLARFPLYAGMAAPQSALFPAPRDELDLDIGELLDELRAAYAIGPWERDVLLDAAARSLLRGDASASAVLDKIDAGPEADGFVCRAATARDCLSELAWDPTARRGLVAESNRALGVASSLGEGGVSIAIVVGER